MNQTEGAAILRASTPTQMWPPIQYADAVYVSNSFVCLIPHLKEATPKVAGVGVAKSGVVKFQVEARVPSPPPSRRAGT